MKNIFLVNCLLVLIGFGSFSYAKEIKIGKNQTVKSIKEGIRLAEEGDTLFILGGIYKEGNILIDKSISLIGLNNPILDGEGKNEILTIQADHVLVRDITFQNVGMSHMKDRAAIKIVNSQHCIVKENKLIDTYFGIYLEKSDSCAVLDNIVVGKAIRESTSGNAIHLWYSSYATIEKNQLSGHRDGIYLEFVENSRIHGNISKGNLRYGLHFMFSNDNVYTENRFENNGAGVAVMYSKRIEMFDNQFLDNQGPAAYGILLKDITDSRIERNDFENNTIGVLAEGSNHWVPEKYILFHPQALNSHL